MKNIYLLISTIALTIFSVGQLFSQTISVTGALSAFEKCSGSVSTSHNFAVAGAALNFDIEVEVLTGLEYSIDNVTFFSTLTLPKISGTVNSTTIHVRMTAAQNATISGNISLTSGEVTETVAVSGTVTTLPVATFSYAGTPYCSNDADPSPAYSGGGVEIGRASCRERV